MARAMAAPWSDGTAGGSRSSAAASIRAVITEDLAAWLQRLDHNRETWLSQAQVIHGMASRACQALGFKGEMKLFGSVMNGFGNFNSDVDLVFFTEPGGPPAKEVLGAVSNYLRTHEGCWNLTHVFHAKAPCLKLTDSSGIEVDLVVNNFLGQRNTLLLAAYRQVDQVSCPGCPGVSRVEAVVRVVKELCRRSGLVGTVDGMLNTYAYTLLCIYYLQVVGILPNLQRDLPASVVVDGCETAFKVPPHGFANDNPASVGDLVYGFFAFYGCAFKWEAHAVSIRLADRKPNFVDKSVLLRSGRAPSWYIEDPFDLNHNLAAMTTDKGRERILSAFQAVESTLRLTRSWSNVCPKGLDRPYEQLFMKVRLRDALLEANIPHELSTLFGQFRLVRVLVANDRKPGQLTDCYVQFDNWEELRQGQSLNEQVIPSLSHQPIALYLSLGYGLLEDLQKFQLYPPYPLGEGKNAAQACQEIMASLPALPFAERPSSAGNHAVSGSQHAMPSSPKMYTDAYAHAFPSPSGNHWPQQEDAEVRQWGGPSSPYAMQDKWSAEPLPATSVPPFPPLAYSGVSGRESDLLQMSQPSPSPHANGWHRPDRPNAAEYAHEYAWLDSAGSQQSWNYQSGWSRGY